MGFKKAEFGNVTFSGHSLDAIIERFGREVSLFNRKNGFVTKRAAYQYGISKLLQSKFISEIWDSEKKKTDRLFANGSMVFVLDGKEDHVITVYDRKYVDRITLGLVEHILADKVEELNRQERDLYEKVIATEATLEFYTSLQKTSGENFAVEIEMLTADVEAVNQEYDDFRRYKAALAKSISVFLA